MKALSQVSVEEREDVIPLRVRYAEELKEINEQMFPKKRDKKEKEAV